MFVIVTVLFHLSILKQNLTRLVNSAYISVIERVCKLVPFATPAVAARGWVLGGEWMAAEMGHLAHS